MQAITIATVFVILLSQYLSYSSAQHTNKYLVFGGNGFIGSELVTLLRLRKSDVTIVNRGNWYWDSEIRIKPYVKHVRCDRYSIKSCSELIEVIEDKDYFDVVYDFSSYIPNHLQVGTDLCIYFHRFPLCPLGWGMAFKSYGYYDYLKFYPAEYGYGKEITLEIMCIINVNPLIS